MFNKFINVKHTYCTVEVPNRQCLSCLDSSLVGASNFSSEDDSSGRRFESRNMFVPMRSNQRIDRDDLGQVSL